ncbi:Box C/D snoRNA protein 1 [Nakaseomyces bracarensis]|uniref:Box C/D snoRNA protein 1 n=1 Tax=Nakaseomyces bracarensis TaxID=273131 RepID=A0ABR4NRX7_9SACH
MVLVGRRDDKTMVVCEVCQQVESRYKCPRCGKRSCSLDCSKRHKVESGCSGQVHDPGYIPSEVIKGADDEKKESNVLVQRDYNYLVQMRRAVEVKLTDGKRKNGRILREAYDPKRQRLNVADSADTVPEPTRLIRRGVSCLMLPRGMQRSSQNKSKWDNSLNQFTWTVEWIVCGADNEKFTHLTHRAKENETIVDGLSKAVFNKICEFYGLSSEESAGVEKKEERTEIIKNSELSFYIKWFPRDTMTMCDSKELIKVDAIDTPLGETLKDRTVIEFPTIYISKKEEYLPNGFTVVDEDVKNGKKKAVPDSDSDSDSDSSSESESDSDSEPEEQSSKPAEAPIKPSTASDSSDDDDEDGYNPGVSLDFLMS